MLDKLGSSPQPMTVASHSDPARVKDAAGQFESLLIGQLMKSARAESSGWLSDGEEDQSNSTATDMAEEQFAKALASHGGLGLARMVMSGLQKSAKSGG
jgi:Rod binding domain-containing protein